MPTIYTDTSLDPFKEITFNKAFTLFPSDFEAPTKVSSHTKLYYDEGMTEVSKSYVSPRTVEAPAYMKKYLGGGITTTGVSESPAVVAEEVATVEATIHSRPQAPATIESKEPTGKRDEPATEAPPPQPKTDEKPKQPSESSRRNVVEASGGGGYDDRPGTADSVASSVVSVVVKKSEASPDAGGGSAPKEKPKVPKAPTHVEPLVLPKYDGSKLSENTKTFITANIKTSPPFQALLNDGSLPNFDDLYDDTIFKNKTAKFGIVKSITRTLLTRSAGPIGSPNDNSNLLDQLQKANDTATLKRIYNIVKGRYQ